MPGPGTSVADSPLLRYADSAIFLSSPSNRSTPVPIKARARGSLLRVSSYVRLGAGSSLRYAHELGLDYEPFGVVWEGAGLEADYVLAGDCFRDLVVVGADDEVGKDAVGVAGAVGVGEDHLVAVSQLVEVPEDEVGVGAGVAEAVAGDVDVGLPFPGVAGPF